MSKKKRARQAHSVKKAKKPERPHWTTAAVWSLSLLLWAAFMLDRVFHVDVPAWLLLIALAADVVCVVWAVWRWWRTKDGMTE